MKNLPTTACLATTLAFAPAIAVTTTIFSHDQGVPILA
jgi:hypothetical protein